MLVLLFQRKPSKRIFSFFVVNAWFFPTVVQLTNGSEPITPSFLNKVGYILPRENSPIHPEEFHSRRINLLRPVIKRGDKIAAGLQKTRHLFQQCLPIKPMFNDGNRSNYLKRSILEFCLHEIGNLIADR